MTEKRYQITRCSDGNGYSVREWQGGERWWPVMTTITLWGARRVVRRLLRLSDVQETYPAKITPENAKSPALENS